ncbi:MAG TPA: hypothetical protein DCE63_03015 [Eubacterium sp.]|nr:hypothetical protein [Eubacterium sp.]HBD65920.1 hypothetical protein [Eubacterium sp.]HBS90085.1 hypothetical protein [Eubacterium sp.]HCH82379.1 hypothetical protein [Eubacterium sp.]
MINNIRKKKTVSYLTVFFCTLMNLYCIKNNIQKVVFIIIIVYNSCK